MFSVHYSELMAMHISTHTSAYPLDGEILPGGERVARAVAEGLVERGHDVSVYTGGYDMSTKTVSQNGVDVTRYGSITTLGWTPVAPKQLLAGGSTDLIHAHNTTPPGMVSAYIHSLRANAPLVVTHHGTDRHYVPSGGYLKSTVDYAFVEVFLDRILSRASVITSPSISVLDESPRLQQYRDSIIEIPNGIDEELPPETPPLSTFDIDLNLDPEDVVLLFLGSLTPKKSPDLFMDAIHRIDEDVVGVIAGGGRLHENLKRQAGESIHVLGRVSEKLKWALFERADVYCLPSSIPTEVFPLTILESYVSGTPVVVSNLSTFDSFVHSEKTGLRFRRGDTAGLANEFDKLVKDADLRTSMSEYARKEGDKYRWNTIIDEYEELFRTLTN